MRVSVKKYISSLSLRVKILVLSLLCLFFALVIQSILFIKTSSSVINRQSRDYAKVSLSNISDDFYSFSSEVNYSLLKVYDFASLKEDLYYSSDVSMLRKNYGSLCYKMAVTSLENIEGLSSLYLYRISPDGQRNLVSSYRKANTPKYSFPEDAFLTESALIEDYLGSSDTSMLVTSYYNKSRESLILRYCIKILHNLDETAGLLVLDVEPVRIREIVNRQRGENGSIIWFQRDNEGSVFVSSNVDDKKMQTYFMIEDLIQRGDKESFDKVKLHSFILFVGKKNKYGLTPYYLYDQSSIRKNLSYITRNLLIVFVSVSVFSFIVFSLLSKAFTRPLEDMVKTIQKIKEGKGSLRMSEPRQKEYVILVKEFNAMMDRLKMLVSRELASMLYINESRYKALQTQINPHFLYNTLGTMASIASIKGCSEVSSICVSLSAMFRYSLDMTSGMAVLEDEIRHLDNYLQVMNVRMQNSIRVDYEIGSEMMKFKIVRLSLQPIVENCIKHGFKNKRGEKIITISCRKDYDRNDVYVQVKDNGSGCDADEINRRLNSEEYDVLSGKDSIGLLNIQSRIRILFGNDYGLIVKSSEEGTVVTMKVSDREAGL